MSVATLLQFVKENWKEILIVICLLLVIGKMRVDYNQLEKTYLTSQQSLQNQISSLQQIHQEELEKREVALREYEEQLADIEQRYLANQAELLALKDKSKKKYIKKFSEDPKILVEDIETMFGFRHVD